MSWKKKMDSNLLGVPLDELLLMLQPTTIKAHQDGNAIVARHEHYTTRIEVVPPEQRESENYPIRAVVRIKTELPSQLKDHLIKAPELVNKSAALGALTCQHDQVFVGSRLTIHEADYEAEDVWRNLHLPLLLTTTICGTEAILGAMRRILSEEEHTGGNSEWTEDDMKQVVRFLSQECVCSTGGFGFTAEFGLAEGAVSALAGDHLTALLQLKADMPHPELGGGLLCLLQMPHRLDNEAQLRQVCVQLNNMEMAAQDLPPHFGAWCAGHLLDNPAYVTFLPNALHISAGIAVNMAIWALHRARWANAMLASRGVHA